MVSPAQRSSVQQPPPYDTPPGGSMVFQIASVADEVTPYGSNVGVRDWQLRQFWPKEPILKSAIYSIVARNSAYSWTLDGPPRTVRVAMEMMHDAHLGGGYLAYVQRWVTDWLTQDNGAFTEIIRSGKGANSPVIGFAHLDAGRCRRTGNPEYPVVYADRKGREHRLEPHQVIMSADMPSPVETMNGAGMCAVSRVLEAAVLLRDISRYTREKVSGRNPAAIHLVSGVNISELDDVIARHRDHQLEKGMVAYVLPVLMATLDPTANISHEQIDLASLPDGFNLEESMRWYINQLALGFGGDYQDFAPLPGRSLGSSTQSMILHEKSRGRGPAMFMKTLETTMNFGGILPTTVTFRFDEKDFAMDLDQAEIAKAKGEARNAYITTGVFTAEAVRQIMLDEGEISQEIFDMLQAAPDVTPNVNVTDQGKVSDPGASDGDVITDEDSRAETGQSAKKKTPDYPLVVRRANPPTL